MQVHACMLALHTGRPVKMMYGREESFFGHIHRHPARMRYEHHATRDGRLVAVRARILLDGGAYASSSTAVCSNAASFACGPYDVPNALIDAYVVYTDNPPCGAMRGFGAVQTCFAHEAQMDKLAAELGIDPVELRRRNALATGKVLPTGAEIRCPAPVEELLERVSAMPMPPGERRRPVDIRQMPGGVSNVTHGEGVRRGIGYAVGVQEHRLLRGLRRLLDRPRPAVAGARRAARRGPHRRGRGRPGARHRAAADREHRAGRGAGRGAAGRHERGDRRLLLGLAADDDDRRRGQAGVRGGDGGAAGSARRVAGGEARRRSGRGDARVPPPADRSRSTTRARATRT